MAFFAFMGGRLSDARGEGTNVERAIGDVLLWLVSIPFFVLGWVVGAVWLWVSWIVAAFVAGFDAGRGKGS